MNIYEKFLTLGSFTSSLGWLVIKNQLRHSVARACDHTLWWTHFLAYRRSRLRLVPHSLWYHVHRPMIIRPQRIPVTSGPLFTVHFRPYRRNCSLLWQTLLFLSQFADGSCKMSDLNAKLRNQISVCVNFTFEDRNNLVVHSISRHCNKKALWANEMHLKNSN